MVDEGFFCTSSHHPVLWALQLPFVRACDRSASALVKKEKKEKKEKKINEQRRGKKKKKKKESPPEKKSDVRNLTNKIRISSVVTPAVKVICNKVYVAIIIIIIMIITIVILFLKTHHL